MYALVYGVVVDTIRDKKPSQKAVLDVCVRAQNVAQKERSGPPPPARRPARTRVRAPASVSRDHPLHPHLHHALLKW